MTVTLTREQVVNLISDTYFEVKTREVRKGANKSQRLTVKGTNTGMEFKIDTTPSQLTEILMGEVPTKRIVPKKAAPSKTKPKTKEKVVADNQDLILTGASEFNSVIPPMSSNLTLSAKGLVESEI